MRIVLQRVSQASVTVGDRTTGKIGPGFLALVGFAPEDDETVISWMAEKIAELRLFADDDGKMNRSIRDTGGAVLVVSQFTLYGDARKGRRPSFIGAAPPELARSLYDRFVNAMRDTGCRVETGEFGAMMQVALVNDGPVTLILERQREQLP
jgi:D-aminoacyl-tRNA deacylase